MTNRELIEWAFSIALVIGLVGVTAVGVLFLSWCTTQLVGYIMESLADAKRSFEKLKNKGV